VWKTVFLGSGRSLRKEKHERGKTIEAQRLSLQSLTPDEMVTTHPRNIEIPYHDINSVEITRQLFQLQLRFYVSRPSTGEQVIHFNLTKNQIPEAQRLLEQALPLKTKGK
jgi:hypothetical protein